MQLLRALYFTPGQWCMFAYFCFLVAWTLSLFTRNETNSPRWRMLGLCLVQNCELQNGQYMLIHFENIPDKKFCCCFETEQQQKEHNVHFEMNAQFSSRHIGWRSSRNVYLFKMSIKNAKESEKMHLVKISYCAIQSAALAFPWTLKMTSKILFYFK